MATQEERHLAVVAALYEATGSANWPAVATHLTDDFFVSEGSMMPFTGVYRGRDALRELYTKVMGMMDVTGLDIRARTAGDNHVVVLLDMVLAGTPEVRAPIAEIFRFRGDKVCEIQPFYFDPAPVIAAVNRRRQAKAG